MYAISEEESFLPATISGNHAHQLAQVRGYYERQKTLTSYFAHDIESIRMSYCLRLCKEKERLGKSLWDLENKKRRLLHQITQPTSNARTDWRLKSISEAKKAERLRNKKQELKTKSERTFRRKESRRVDFERLEPITTAESQVGRQRRKSKGNKEKDDTKKHEIDIPMFLLR